MSDDELSPYLRKHIYDFLVRYNKQDSGKGASMEISLLTLIGLARGELKSERLHELQQQAQTRERKAQLQLRFVSVWILIIGVFCWVLARYSL